MMHDCNGPLKSVRLLIFQSKAGRSRRFNPAFGAAAGGRSSPVLAMLAMLGAEEAPARGCAWLRSSLRGG